jgi:hypothetical protein
MTECSGKCKNDGVVANSATPEKREENVLKIGTSRGRFECHWTEWIDANGTHQDVGVHRIYSDKVVWICDPLDYDLNGKHRNGKGRAVLPLVLETADGNIEIISLDRALLWDGRKLIMKMLRHGIQLNVNDPMEFIDYVRALDKHNQGGWP